MLTLNLAGTAGDSIVDGPGIRFTVFAQGCSFNCPGCQNPQTHAFGAGQDHSVDELVSQVRRNPLVRGVTLSGGDPLFQAEGFAALAARLKALGYEVAAYTGFTWEDLVTQGTPAQKELLGHLDILVDGPFVVALRDLNLRFRGSSNQRVIDVPQSLARLASGEISPALCQAARWVGRTAC
jgi:anaerobic ribonucleoside-triphosphate reductase activating protein